MGFTIPGLPSVTPSTKDITLSVQGVEYRHWKAITITRSLMQFAGSFSLTVSNRFSDKNEDWKAYLDQECTVKLGDEQVIDGYIDEVPISYNQKNFNISFNGRDRTADLVDCSYDISQYPGEFLNQTTSTILNKLVFPFGISITASLELEVELSKTIIKKYKVNAGAPVFEEINKICQRLGILPVSFGDGKLTLIRTGFLKTKDGLEGGVNIKAASYNQSNRNRFGKYQVFGQKQQKNKWTQEVSTKIEANFLDSHIRPARTLVIRDSSLRDNGAAKARAAWEMRIRAGQSRPLVVVVQDWVQSNDDIWPMNKLVPIVDKKLGIAAEFLIVGTTFELGEEIGSQTTLNLVHPDAFQLKKRDVQEKEFKTLSEKIKALQLPSIPGVN